MVRAPAAPLRNGELRTGGSAQLSPAAGPVVLGDLPDHGDEPGPVDPLALADRDLPAGLIVVAGRDDPGRGVTVVIEPPRRVLMRIEFEESLEISHVEPTLDMQDVGSRHDFSDVADRTRPGGDHPGDR